MGIRCPAIEWRRTLPIVAVAALHPGATDTVLSRPCQRRVPAGGLFSAAWSAARMVELLRSLSLAQNGAFRAYNGEPLPW